MGWSAACQGGDHQLYLIRDSHHLHSCPALHALTSLAPLIHDPLRQGRNSMSAWPNTSHNVRPVTPSLSWITLRHRVPLSPLWRGETLARKLVVRRAHADGAKGPTGSTCPLTTTETRLSFFPAQRHRDGGSVRRGRDPTRSREHHEPILHAFPLGHGFDLPCKCLVEEMTTDVLKPEGLVPS